MKQIFTIILLIPFLSFAQTKPYTDRHYSDTIPEAYKLDISKLREHIYAGIPDKLKKDKYETMTYVFADQNAVGISEFISAGNIYSDWKEMEEYLNKILKKLIPKELEKDSVIHLYIVQDGDFNAFMVPSGHVFFNIGVLGDVCNEACIASILTHELAHYYKKHSLNYYIEEKAGNFKEGMIFRNKSDSRFSISQELQADSLGMVWYKKAGYSLYDLKRSFEIMSRMERNIIRRIKDKDELEETTHPSSAKRLEKINEFIAKYKGEKGEKFLVSKAEFNKLKEEAKPEILKHLLNSFDYYQCIEKAFKFHLFDPDNPVYINYIVEGIRRKCYLDVNIWNELFITNRYYHDVSHDDIKMKGKMKDHIFKSMDLDILGMDEDESNNIIAKFYWNGEIKFKTYEEAFVFFLKVSQILNDNETILSNALSFTTDKKTRNEFLELYLSKENIKHREFAQNLLDGTAISKFSNKKLLVFNDLSAAVREGKNDIPIRNYSSKIKNELACIFDTVMLIYKDRKPIFLPDMKYYHLNDYNDLLGLQKFSFIPIVAKGEKTELHILAPEFWEIFKKYDVNEIEFITCQYTEIRGSDKTVDTYKNIIKSSYNDIFAQTNKTRFLDTYISSVREIKDAVMKVKHYGGSNKLKINKTGYSQIVSEINTQIAEKEKTAEKMDRYFKDEK